MIKRLIVVLSLLAAVVFTGCFLFPSSFSPEDNYIYQSAQEAGPRFYAEARAIGVESRDVNPSAPVWSMGDPIYELYRLLEEYDPAGSSEDYSMENVYRVVYDAGMAYIKIKDAPFGGVETFDETALTPKFDFGNNFTYDHGFNSTETNDGNDYTQSGAYRVDEATGMEYFMAMMLTVASGQTAMDIMEGSINSETGSIDLDYVRILTYDNLEFHSARLELSGNTETKDFTIRLTEAADGNTGFQNEVTLAGTGTGTGTDPYYLFRVSDSSGTSGTAYYQDPRYYIFPAGATVTELQDIDRNGYAEGEITSELDPEGYLETVSAMTLLNYDPDYDFGVEPWFSYNIEEDLPRNFTDVGGTDVTLDF